MTVFVLIIVSTSVRTVNLPVLSAMNYAILPLTAELYKIGYNFEPGKMK